MNTGHGEDNSDNESLAIQTPAVDFILLNHTVSNSHKKDPLYFILTFPLTRRILLVITVLSMYC